MSFASKSSREMRELRLVLLNKKASRDFVASLLYRLARERPTQPIRALSCLADRIELQLSFPVLWTDDIKAQVGELAAAGLVQDPNVVLDDNVVLDESTVDLRK